MISWNTDRFDERANVALQRALREALSQGHAKITVEDLERGIARERADRHALRAITAGDADHRRR